MDQATFENLAKRGNVIALSRRLMSDQLTPVLAYRRLVTADERTAPSFLFESVEGGTSIGRHSFLGAQPCLEVVARGHEVTITDHRTGREETRQDDNPLGVFKAMSKDWKPVTADDSGGRTKPPPFTGGWVGYAGYDTVRYLAPKIRVQHVIGPVMQVQVDGARGQGDGVGLQTLDERRQLPHAVLVRRGGRVMLIQHHMNEGMQHLVHVIYLQAKGSILVASSPEILCRAEGDIVTNRPLAGTRRRGATQQEDEALERELRNDAKECAEHVMLVDLGRNDLGRVCELASIEVPRIMEIERYSHVMHLSSTVTGKLRKNLDAWDALRGTLPVGTVSGAPKVRAMQIIDELEPTRRGPYAGGIGFVSFKGDMDIAIALRTMVFPTAHWKDGTWTVHLQAGAGIVADSIPGVEFEDTVSKAAALSRAIELAEAAFG